MNLTKISLKGSTTTGTARWRGGGLRNYCRLASPSGCEVALQDLFGLEGRKLLKDRALLATENNS